MIEAINIPCAKYRVDVFELKIDNPIPNDAQSSVNPVSEFISHAKMKSDLLMILFDVCGEVLLSAQSLAKDNRPEADELLTICRSAQDRAMMAIAT